MAILFVQANVYSDPSGGCVAFIANMDEQNDRSIIFQNRSYNVPAWSVSILPDCKNVAFNTAKVSLLSHILLLVIFVL